MNKRPIDDPAAVNRWRDLISLSRRAQSTAASRDSHLPPSSALRLTATTGSAAVTVAGIEPLQDQGLELRMNVNFRVQNPNDAPLDYNGVAVEMDVQGKTFAPR